MENTDTSYCTNLSFTGDLLKVVNGRLTYGSRSRTYGRPSSGRWPSYGRWQLTEDQVMVVYGGPSSGRWPSYGSDSWQRTKLWSFMEEQVLVIDQVMVADSWQRTKLWPFMEDQVLVVYGGTTHGRLWRNKFWSLTKLW